MDVATRFEIELLRAGSRRHAVCIYIYYIFNVGLLKHQ